MVERTPVTINKTNGACQISQTGRGWGISTIRNIPLQQFRTSHIKKAIFFANKVTCNETSTSITGCQ